jgi:uncharacterized protein with HEPN domain
MTPLRAPKRLRDARSACDEIVAFTDGKTLDDYRSDRGLRLIVERLFEILGEALNLAWQEDAKLSEQIPDLREIVGMRHRIIHGYDLIRDDVLWDTVQNDIPSLRGHINHLLEERGWV